MISPRGYTSDRNNQVPALTMRGISGYLQTYEVVWSAYTRQLDLSYVAGFVRSSKWTEPPAYVYWVIIKMVDKQSAWF